jgi:hypothetical protein
MQQQVQQKQVQHGQKGMRSLKNLTERLIIHSLKTLHLVSNA